ncbi:hypothetical protein GCM10020000_25140 [Streptomyces olivoverticillatus]
MTRSVYVTGTDRGDGRQVIELGVMELLTRKVDRVGVFRPLFHGDGPDRLFDLLRSRYRLEQSADTAYGLTYGEASALQAERGTDELVSTLVERFHAVARHYENVLVLGTDFAATNLPDELALNARLANEFGASVLTVVGGQEQPAESVRAEARNAYRAYESLGCDVVALVVNRVAPADREAIAERLSASLPVPCYALPEDSALSAPTVRQIVHKLGAEVLLGDDAGLSRDAKDFVFGGAMLPAFLPALTDGCLVVTPRRPRRPDRGRAGRAQRRRPGDRRRAAHPGRAAGPGHPGARGPAGPGHAGRRGAGRLLPDRGRALRDRGQAGGVLPAQGRNRAGPLRAPCEHRRADRPHLRRPLRPRHPDDVRA